MSFELNIDEGRFLVKLARGTIETFLEKGEKRHPPADTSPKLKEKRGVFVTLNRVKGDEKELRGCIGFPLPDFPLVEATIEAAISAAVRDPRFSPVTSEEMSDTAIEVTVLTPPTLMEINNPRDYLKEIKIGRDGLIVERSWCKGLLLPQVPIEWSWDCEEFLANCCMKAGLPPDSWLVKGTKIYKFSSVIAKELSPNGIVEVVDMREGGEQL